MSLLRCLKQNDASWSTDEQLSPKISKPTESEIPSWMAFKMCSSDGESSSTRCFT